jgi:DNA-binding transcriptional MerR regulator
MFIDGNSFEEWMKRIMERFDRLENRMKKPEKEYKTVNGEKLPDNQDLCLMLNCSKRTLQRYRVSGLLPCKRFSQKTYYLESDVLRFICEYLQKPTGKSGKG